MSDQLPRPHERTLADLMNGLAEASLAMSDEALLTETRDGGEDPAWAAASVRDLLRATGKTFRQRHLRAAAAEYQRRTASLKRGWLDLPETPDQRRSLLASVLARNPRVESALLTMQHREFKELSDSDVESCLAQLKELGVLGDDEGE